ncbi:MarR family winged helix-turn-helix transcriptional regulator [Dictyobacter kobayashii]|uniref:Transcriptional regulator n=1 Tax=Dictyobacter kobayashii TaxID=2014872 RepID=A0A402ATQ0_9CHLR|nr:MarR family transcriptional regulator [Dictyobacter kobayashii]GCE22491.1 transcriptional regulator [Dictyobacter kobayashii]
MSRDRSGHDELLVALERAGRKYSESSVLLHQAIADTLGLNITDLKCLDLIRESHDMTPGKLAKLTGLTTGAVTGIIDRLEKAGYAQRERDGADRRKISLRAHPEQIFSKLTPIFTSFQQAMAAEFNATYSDQDMALILDFVERSTRVMQAETWKMRHHLDEQNEEQQPVPSNMTT